MRRHAAIVSILALLVITINVTCLPDEATADVVVYKSHPHLAEEKTKVQMPN